MGSTNDPRAQRSREKILDAVRSILLSEGAEAVTHQRVADVAGVGRATVYRHWKSADEMIYALLDENPFRLLDVPADIPLQQRLTSWLSWMTSLLADPQRRAVILHVLSRSDMDARAHSLRINRVAELVSHLDAAIGKTGCWQKLPQATKIDGIVLLVGPLMMRVVFLATAPSSEQVQNVVENFLFWLDRQSQSDSDSHGSNGT